MIIPMDRPAAASTRPRLEMIEGPEALERFESAVRAILTVPKGAVPNPFGRRKGKRKKPTAPKG